MTHKETMLGMIAWGLRRLRDPLGARRLVEPVTLEAHDLPGLDRSNRA